MKKLYTIRRADFFEAIGKKQLPEDVRILYAGTLWMDVLLSEEERNAYRYPIL